MSLFNSTIIGGVDTSDATATAGDVLSPKTLYLANGEKATGTILSKGAQTYTPMTGNQTIPAGQFLSGAQTILGDPDLTAANIRSGVDLFGVLGNFKGGWKYAKYDYPTETSNIYISGLAFKPLACFVLWGASMTGQGKHGVIYKTENNTGAHLNFGITAGGGGYISSIAVAEGSGASVAYGYANSTFTLGFSANGIGYSHQYYSDGIMNTGKVSGTFHIFGI